VDTSISWIRPLAAPYLRGYRARVQRSGSLRGYWFLRLGTAPAGKRARKNPEEVGFFIGYLVKETGYEFLKPAVPECLIFAFVQPLGGAAHRRLVGRRDALVRKTFNYIRWLTHRPPRFVFHDDALAALTRHLSSQDWPRRRREHLSRNFFIETLAWLVRSGLVRKLKT